MDTFCAAFENAVPELRVKILARFKKSEIVSGFRSVWENFETIVNPVLIEFLTGDPLRISKKKITEAKSKSVYPDLKVEFDQSLYAIDVKSGEDDKNPWYDIGRLDTFEEKRLNVFAAEYSVVVRWRGREKTEIPNVYIEPTFRTVGYRQESEGVLYRPYDGKVRPKSWDEFEGGTSHWRDEDHFREGLIASRNFRRKSYIGEWYKAMNAAQRVDLRQTLEAIDRGERVNLDEVDPGETD